MGRRGPKPQPSVLQIVRGNPGRRPPNTAEPELAPAKRDVPAGLKGSAKKEWLRLIDELTTKGVLTVGDLRSFEQYCRIVGEVDAYEKLIARVGREAAHKLGYANYLLKLRTQERQERAHLGLTPSSRSGVKTVTKRKPVDPAEEFFGGKKTG
jgi:P27 family predicted phage terminase small subunit